MQLVRSTCPRCDEVTLLASEVTVMIAGDLDGTAYRFECPTCQREVIRTTQDHLVDALLAAGCEVAPYYVPSHVVPHPSRSAPFTDADVESFSLLLEQPDWFDQLLALG